MSQQLSTRGAPFRATVQNFPGGTDPPPSRPTYVAEKLFEKYTALPGFPISPRTNGEGQPSKPGAFRLATEILDARRQPSENRGPRAFSGDVDLLQALPPADFLPSGHSCSPMVVYFLNQDGVAPQPRLEHKVKRHTWAQAEAKSGPLDETGGRWQPGRFPLASRPGVASTPTTLRLQLTTRHPPATGGAYQALTQPAPSELGSKSEESPWYVWMCATARCWRWPRRPPYNTQAAFPANFSPALFRSGSVQRSLITGSTFKADQPRRIALREKRGPSPGDKIKRFRLPLLIGGWPAS